MRVLALTLLTGMLLLAPLTGCETAEIELLGGNCSEDSQCAGDLTCHQSFCVQGVENDIELRARVLPPPTTGLLQQQRRLRCAAPTPCRR